MKKYLLLLSLLTVFVTSVSSAPKILLWHTNPDNRDTYTDPEAGKAILLDYFVKQSLTANGYIFDYHSGLTLPADISSYDAVWCAIGFLVC